MIIKSLFCKSNGRNALYDAQEYVCDELKVHPGGIYTYNCGITQWSPANLSTKVVYRKKEQGKHYQIILGFDPADKVTPEKAIRIGRKTVRHFRDRYVLFGVHTNTGHIHIHFLISYTTIYGKQEGMTKAWLSDFKSFVSGIAEEEHCCPVRMHNKDWKPINGIHSKDGQDDPELEIDDSDYLGEPEEVLFENVPAVSSPKTIFGYPPDYVPQQRTTINYNYTTNYYFGYQQYPKKRYNKNGYYGSDSSWNTNQSFPQLPSQPQRELTTNETITSAQLEFTGIYAPDVQASTGMTQPDFSSVIPSIPAPESASVIPAPAAPAAVIEYCLCIDGISTGIDKQPLYRFADYYSAVQYGLGLKMYGHSVCIFQITNGVVNPFVTNL